MHDHDNPKKTDVQITQTSKVQRLAIEGIGKRNQVWVSLEHADGTMDTYFNYLDEGYTVVLQQIAVLRDAVANPSLRVILHYIDVGSTKRFHAVTMLRAD